MPYLSVVEVAEKIREYQANGDVSLQTKVVLATGETRCIDEKSLFDKIIMKPIKAAEFRQFIVGLNLWFVLNPWKDNLIVYLHYYIMKNNVWLLT